MSDIHTFPSLSSTVSYQRSALKLRPIYLIVLMVY